MGESLAAAQLSQQQQQQQHDHVVTQMHRQNEKRVRMLVEGMEAEIEGDRADGEAKGSPSDDGELSELQSRALRSPELVAISAISSELPTTIRLQLDEAAAPLQPWQHSAQPWLQRAISTPTHAALGGASPAAPSPPP